MMLVLRVFNDSWCFIVLDVKLRLQKIEGKANAHSGDHTNFITWGLGVFKSGPLIPRDPQDLGSAKQIKISSLKIWIRGSGEHRDWMTRACRAGRFRYLPLLPNR